MDRIEVAFVIEADEMMAVAEDVGVSLKAKVDGVVG